MTNTIVHKTLNVITVNVFNNMHLKKPSRYWWTSMIKKQGSFLQGQVKNQTHSLGRQRIIIHTMVVSTCLLQRIVHLHYVLEVYRKNTSLTWHHKNSINASNFHMYSKFFSFLFFFTSQQYVKEGDNTSDKICIANQSEYMNYLRSGMIFHFDEGYLKKACFWLIPVFIKSGTQQKTNYYIL